MDGRSGESLLAINFRPIFNVKLAFQTVFFAGSVTDVAFQIVQTVVCERISLVSLVSVT